MANSNGDWQALAAKKRESNYEKIPKDWRLPSSLTDQFTETSTLNVLDVPKTCVRFLHLVEKAILSSIGLMLIF